MTLVCGEIVVEGGASLLDSEIEFPYKSYPAIKIARLAVDTNHRDQDIGRRLVDFALGQAKFVVCPAVGCRFAVVDAKRCAVGFYSKCGFTLLDTEDNRNLDAPIMFIDLHKVAITRPGRTNSAAKAHAHLSTPICMEFPSGLG
jgi:GNAT superfamily N-acetyltransferase